MRRCGARSAVVIWLLAAFYFQEAAEQAVFAPTDSYVFLATDLGSCRINWTACSHDKMTEYTTFQPFLYSADVLLPIVSLGQDTSWSPMVKPISLELPMVGRLHLSRWVTVSVMWFEIFFGWIAGLILIAVFSGAVKRD
jgi:hypothetical protein